MAAKKITRIYPLCRIITIPSKLVYSNIEVSTIDNNTIPNSDGTFNLPKTNLVFATNKSSGELIYIACPQIKGDGTSNSTFELNSKETAIYLLLNSIPFGLFKPSSDKTFNDFKELLYSISETKALEQKVKESIDSKGYLDIDFILPSLGLALKAYSKQVQTNTFSPFRTGTNQQTFQSGNIYLNNPKIQPDNIGGIKLELNKSTYITSTNSWDLGLTGYSDYGCFMGVVPSYTDPKNKNYFVYNRDEILYYLPPMTGTKFVGNLTTFEGIKKYIQYTEQLLSGGTSIFDFTTWDKTEMKFNYTVDSKYNSLAIVSPKDDPNVFVANIIFSFFDMWTEPDLIGDFKLKDENPIWEFVKNTVKNPEFNIKWTAYVRDRSIQNYSTLVNFIFDRERIEFELSEKTLEKVFVKVLKRASYNVGISRILKLKRVTRAGLILSVGDGLWRLINTFGNQSTYFNLIAEYETIADVNINDFSKSPVKFIEMVAAKNSGSTMEFTYTTGKGESFITTENFYDISNGYESSMAFNANGGTNFYISLTNSLQDKEFRPIGIGVYDNTFGIIGVPNQTYNIVTNTSKPKIFDGKDHILKTKLYNTIDSKSTFSIYIDDLVTPIYEVQMPKKIKDLDYFKNINHRFGLIFFNNNQISTQNKMIVKNWKFTVFK